ncbi:MAG: acyltransferase family protein [bacterium]
MTTVAASARKSPEHLSTLDGWRGLAILAVLLGHGKSAILPPDAQYNALDLGITSLGGYGVELFFAISGLLICYRLGCEKAWNGRLDLLEFYGRRLFRLLPAAFFYLFFVCVIAAVGLVAISTGEILASLFFFRNYWTAFNMPGSHYTAHFWSLSVEEQFYLVIPLLIAIDRRRALLYGLPLASIAVGLWRGVESRLRLGSALLPALQFDTGRTDLCIDHLMWGAWFGLVLASPDGRQMLARYTRPAAIQLALAGLFFMLISQPVPMRKLWFAWVAPALLVATILNPSSWLGLVLENRPLAWVGRISYSLYLWQQLFLLQSGTPDTEFAALPLRTLQNYPFGLPATFLAAIISYYLLEQPLRRRGYRWLGKQLRK